MSQPISTIKSQRVPSLLKKSSSIVNAYPAHAARFLKEMHDRKEIESKHSGKHKQTDLLQSLQQRHLLWTGKQVVYHCLQDPAEAASADDLADLDSTIADLRNKLADCKSSERSLKRELSLLSSVTSAADLRSTVEALETQRQGLLERLRQLKKIEVKPVSEAEKTAAEFAHKTWEKHASGRKRIFKDLWAKCVEHLPDGMVKEDLWVGDDYHAQRHLSLTANRTSGRAWL
jgi:26S proteasome regulatory subunit, ATPase 3, interacting protein